MKKPKHLLFPILIAALNLGGCASTWSSAQVERAELRQTSEAPATGKKDIVISEGDITDRKYQSLGDLSVTVNKTTIFHADPTREMVVEKLRDEAVKLGADAVIFVRYGSVGVSMLSWGSLDGKGRAIKFVK